jgi:hypothetical protein
VPIYENLVIGSFLYGLGLRVGAHRHDCLAPDFAVHLTQQTPLDKVLGDVLLAGQTSGQKSVALLEFKREANWEGRWKERSKLLKIEAFLKRPEYQDLRQTSKRIHFYVETSDKPEEGLSSRVLPYLDLATDEQGRRLEQLIDDLVTHASSPLVKIEACQLYLNLLCYSQGYGYYASPGLLVGVRGDGRIAFATLEDLRDLQNTLEAIQAQQIILAQRAEREQRQELTQRQELAQRQERAQRRVLRP